MLLDAHLECNRHTPTKALGSGSLCDYWPGKTGKMDTHKIPVKENTGNLEVLPKHREFCKFPASKDTWIKDIAMFAVKFCNFT